MLAQKEMGRRSLSHAHVVRTGRAERVRTENSRYREIGESHRRCWEYVVF